MFCLLFNLQWESRKPRFFFGPWLFIFFRFLLWRSKKNRRKYERIERTERVDSFWPIEKTMRANREYANCFLYASNECKFLVEAPKYESVRNWLFSNPATWNYNRCIYSEGIPVIQGLRKGFDLKIVFLEKGEDVWWCLMLVYRVLNNYRHRYCQAKNVHTTHSPYIRSTSEGVSSQLNNALTGKQ